MIDTFTDVFEANQEQFYAVFRIAVGLLFVQHGAQKLFGVLGGNQVELISMFGAAGAIELVGGLLIALGLLTRVAALFGIADMIGAQVIVHFPQGFVPIQNGGELSMMFLFSFLVILSQGAGEWSLEKTGFGKELF